MSTETINQQEIAAGTWAVDPVHSSIGFAVTHNGVTTFRSGFERYDAHLSGGEQPAPRGHGRGRERRDRRGDAEGPPALPRVLRRPALPAAALRLERAQRRRGRQPCGSLGELEIHGEKREVDASGRFAQLGADLAGKARVGLSIEATVDRRNFGLDWQAQLPSGGDVLDYAVTIAVELELVAEEA